MSYCREWQRHTKAEGETAQTSAPLGILLDSCWTAHRKPLSSWILPPHISLWAATVFVFAFAVALGVLFLLGGLWVGDELRALAPTTRSLPQDPAGWARRFLPSPWCRL